MTLTHRLTLLGVGFGGTALGVLVTAIAFTVLGVPITAGIVVGPTLWCAFMLGLQIGRSE